MDVIQDKEGHDGYLPVCRQVKAVELVVPDNAHYSSHEDRHLRQDPGPERALPVLQHVQQKGHYERYEGDMVECYGYDVAHQTVVRQPIDAQHIPPHMAQCRHQEEGCCPSAQCPRRRDVRRNGVTASQPQIESRHQSQYGNGTVEHEEEGVLKTLLCVHLYIYSSSVAVRPARYSAGVMP